MCRCDVCKCFLHLTSLNAQRLYVFKGSCIHNLLPMTSSGQPTMAAVMHKIRRTTFMSTTIITQLQVTP